jgi:hypothetical protein
MSDRRLDDEEHDEMTAMTADSDLDLAEAMLERRRRRFRFPAVRLPGWLRAGTPALTWIGIVLSLAGFVLIAVAWGQIAGETEVFLQLPYLVSAGMSGLGLIMVGVTLVNVSAKQRDAVERDRQIDRLVSIMEEVRSAIEERDARPAPRRSARK